MLNEQLKRQIKDVVNVNHFLLNEITGTYASMVFKETNEKKRLSLYIFNKLGSVTKFSETTDDPYEINTLIVGLEGLCSLRTKIRNVRIPPYDFHLIQFSSKEKKGNLPDPWNLQLELPKKEENIILQNPERLSAFLDFLKENLDAFDKWCNNYVTLQHSSTWVGFDSYFRPIFDGKSALFDTVVIGHSSFDNYCALKIRDVFQLYSLFLAKQDMCEVVSFLIKKISELRQSSRPDCVEFYDRKIYNLHNLYVSVFTDQRGKRRFVLNHDGGNQLAGKFSWVDDGGTTEQIISALAKYRDVVIK